MLSLSLLLAACGGGSSTNSGIQQVSVEQGPTPFIAVATLEGPRLAGLTSVGYAIQAMPGSASKPVSVGYTVGALIQRGDATAGGTTVKVPVFGLYAGYANVVPLVLTFSDGSSVTAELQVQTPAYVDPNGVYDHIAVNIARSSGEPLGFDFMALKSGLGGPVIIDSDGVVRWVGTGVSISQSAIFESNGFYVGDSKSTRLSRLELDGTTTSVFLNASSDLDFMHNIDPGATNLLVEVDTSVAGVTNFESTIAEATPTGAITSQWDFAALLSAYMSSQGDDPTPFVRPGSDWFHSNSATYDPSDDSLIVSSRENFVIKVDYKTGAIKWILGDPTKYWYTFPSLRAKALTLQPGGLYPIGQHATSLTSDGLLMLFNDGTASASQPIPGASRTYSAVSAYSIDPVTATATEVWRFDYGQTIYDEFCGSAYQAASDGSVLVDYAMAAGTSTARIVGLNPAHEVVLDFTLPSPAACAASWNAVPVPLDALQFD